MRAANVFSYHRYLLAGSLLTVSALLAATGVNGQTTKLSPAKQPPASSTQELQKRIEAQRSAAKNGEPSAVETASRQVVALALQQMAALRSVEHAWPQSAELYRQSLALEDNPDARLALATAAFYAGHNDQALIEVDKLLASDARNSQAWHLKGNILTASQNYRGASEALAHSLELKRDVNVQFALGVALLNLKEKEKAATIFRSMLADYGDRAIWHVVFGGAYRDTKYLDDAIREFRRAIGLDPKAPHVHLFLGLTLLEQNYWGASPEILHEFAEEIKQYPDDYFGNYNLGVLQMEQGQLADSNQHLLIASQSQPTNPDPWLFLGLNAYKSNDYAAAKQYLIKTVELTGEDQARNNFQIRRGYIALGRILVAEGKKEEADQYFTKAKALGAKSMELSSEAISSAVSEGGMHSSPGVMPSLAQPQNANGASQESAVDPTERPDLSTLTDIQLSPAQLKEIQARENELSAVLSTTYNDWGTAEARQKDYASALSHFHAAEKWDDLTPGLMRNVGLAALRLGDQKEAARAFQLAVEKDPRDQLANAMLGMSLFSDQRFADAAKAFNNAGEGVYRDLRMAYAWAFSLVRINDLTKAVEVLTRLNSQPLPAEMGIGVGDLYNQTGDYEDALKVFRKVIQQDPSTPRAHYYAGEALIHLDRPTEAIPEFQEELKLTPDDPNVQYHLAFAMLQTSQKDEAVKLLQTIVTAHPDHAQAQYQLGKAQLDAGQYQAAIEHLEVAAQLDPSKDYIPYQLQSAYRKAGRTADADAELKIYRDMKDKKRDAGNSQPRP